MEEMSRNRGVLGCGVDAEPQLRPSVHVDTCILAGRGPGRVSRGPTGTTVSKEEPPLEEMPSVVTSSEAGQCTCTELLSTDSWVPYVWRALGCAGPCSLPSKPDRDLGRC